jgi:hypothetical protein
MELIWLWYSYLTSRETKNSLPLFCGFTAQ